MRGSRIPSPLHAAAVRAMLEPLERRYLLSGTFAHAGATAMAYDPAGTLHVAYYDTLAKSLKYAERSAAGDWSATITVDPGPQVGSSLSIAVDASGHAGIAYFDAKKADLKYAHFNGGTWDLTRVDTSGNVGQNSSLAFDASGHPLISYFSQTGGDLKLARFDGTRWAKSIIDRSGTAGLFSSIAINPANGTWAVAYEESTRRQVRLATQTSAPVTLDTLGKTRGWSTDVSLAFSPTGAPAVSYYDPAGHGLKLASFAGTWSRQMVVSGNLAAQSELSFDPQSGSPQIAYLDRAGGSVQLAKAQGGGWSSVNLGTGDSVVVARDPLTNSFSVLFTGGSGASVGPALSDPSNLMANVLSNSEIDLNWTDNSTIETAFVIERSADGGATFASLAQVGANVTTYSDLSAGDGQSYVYRVKAMDGTGSSHFAVSQPVTTTLNAPAGLQATANSDGSVHLSWQDQSVGVTGFRIEISPDGIGFADTGLTAASVEQFDDMNAGLDRAWYYRVVPFSALGDGPATPALLVHTAPAAPQHLRIYGEGPTMFQLEWDPIGGSAADLLLQVRLAGTTDTFRTLATIGADQFSHIVTQDADGNALAADAAYEFRLVARNVDGIASFDSNHAIGSTGLIAPENVVAQALSATSALLTWEPNSGSATNYNVYLSTDGNTFALYSATFLQASTLLLPNLSPQTHYWLKVAATDGSQESAGVVVQVDTLPGTPGAAPVNVTAQVSFDNPLWLNVSWSNAASDATGFHVQRCTDDVHFVTIEDVPVTWANYDDPSVVEGTYYYRIVPFGPSGDGTPSVATFATASLANPINLKAIVSTSGTVNLAWTNVSTLATGYQLFAAGDDEIPILVDGAVSPAATNYAVTHFADGTPLTSGAAYSFYLVPTGDVGAMGSSQWARAVNGFAAPPEVDVTPTADGQMTIDWTDVGDEIGYQIESSTDGVQYTFVATVGTDITHYVQTDLSETARVYYRVKALGTGGDSAYTASSATNVSPNAPTNLVVTPLAGGSFHLTWDDNSSNEDGYAVRFITPNGDTLIPAQLSANATSCTITQTDLGGLAMPGHGFTFQVVGFRWLSSTTQPAEVDNVQALA